MIPISISQPFGDLVTPDRSVQVTGALVAVPCEGSHQTITLCPSEFGTVRNGFHAHPGGHPAVPSPGTLLKNHEIHLKVRMKISDFHLALLSAVQELHRKPASPQPSAGRPYRPGSLSCTTPTHLQRFSSLGETPSQH